MVNANQMTYIPNTTTTPPAGIGGLAATIISTTSVVGTISGSVTNVAGGVISPPIPVTAGEGDTATVGANGPPTSPASVNGVLRCHGQPGRLNANYATQTQPAVLVTMGDLTSNINASRSRRAAKSPAG